MNIERLVELAREFGKTNELRIHRTDWVSGPEWDVRISSRGEAGFAFFAKGSSPEEALSSLERQLVESLQERARFTAEEAMHQSVRLGELGLSLGSSDKQASEVAT